MQSLMDSSKSDAPDGTKSTDIVSVWQMMCGKVTEVLVRGEVFVVRDDYPKELDPVKVAAQFLKVFDIGQTKIRRKVLETNDGSKTYYVTKGKKSDPSVHRTYNKRTKHTEGKEPSVDVVNNIGIYKHYITGFYRRFPNSFMAADLDNYFQEMFPDVTFVTCTNKRRAYTLFMVKEGFVKRTELKPGAPRLGYTYEFIKAPYDEQPAAQAEFDPEYLKQSVAMQLLTMRSA
jgi:hypothetical protein